MNTVNTNVVLVTHDKNDPKHKWTEDRDEVLAFAHALDELGAFDEPSMVIRFFEKPWKWSPEFARWVELKRPSGDKLRDQWEFIMEGEEHESV